MLTSVILEQNVLQKWNILFCGLYEELDIKNGDIIAITTNIKGLDVVHTGFACWVDGKLHLLHASSVMKKVILDSQTLFEYSKNKKAHTGVRVISFSSLKP